MCPCYGALKRILLSQHVHHAAHAAHVHFLETDGGFEEGGILGSFFEVDPIGRVSAGLDAYGVFGGFADPIEGGGFLVVVEIGGFVFVAGLAVDGLVADAFPFGIGGDVGEGVVFLGESHFHVNLLGGHDVVEDAFIGACDHDHLFSLHGGFDADFLAAREHFVFHLCALDVGNHFHAVFVGHVQGGTGEG